MSVLVKIFGFFVFVAWNLCLGPSSWGAFERWPTENCNTITAFCEEGRPGFGLVQRLEPEQLSEGDLTRCEFFKVDPPFDVDCSTQRVGQACLHSDDFLLHRASPFKIVVPLQLNLQSDLSGEAKEALLRHKVFTIRLFRLNPEKLMLEVAAPEMNYDVRSLVQHADDQVSLDPTQAIHLNFENFLISPTFQANEGERISVRVDFWEPSIDGFSNYEIKVGNQMRWICVSDAELVRENYLQDKVLEF